jgi:hypothetical protein
MKDIALGLAHHGTLPRRHQGFPNPHSALAVFSRKRNAVSWHYWLQAGLTPTTDARFDFEAAFIEATGHAHIIHFNLDGYNLRFGWRDGQGALRDDNQTNWEFVRILRDPDSRKKVLFWQNGRQVPLSRVIERAGVPPNAIAAP